MINYLTDALYGAAQWTHQSIAELPVAGHVYTKFNENISAPLWGLGCKGKDFATPYFKSFYEFTASKMRQNPVITGIIVTGMIFVVVRAALSNSKDNP